MDSEYDRKFEEMKKYIPFLESMIKQLESTSSSGPNPRQAQLDKIRSLRDLLQDKKKRMKMENLLKCEQVLVNLYAKIDQRGTLPGIGKNLPPTPPPPPIIRKPDLSSVRNKLKNVVEKFKRHEEETLPEIARASEIEEICTPGSKEPALFQRRPNKQSLSPTPSQKSDHKSTPKRNYTRVLVSPDREPKTYSKSTDRSPDKLYRRRSPHRSPRRSSPSYKKERKKPSSSQKKKSRDLNITLDVPEESLGSLQTKDIVSRIINCDDNDVDITTLRELKSKILDELKQTGASEDITDLILKSYKKKKKPKIKTKTDMEEGELSDSESEMINNVYGSVVVVNKDKSTSEVKTSSKETDKESRKIQICLVYNTDKDIETAKPIKPQETDVSDFEMFEKSSNEKSPSSKTDPDNSSTVKLKSDETKKATSEKSSMNKSDTDKLNSERILDEKKGAKSDIKHQNKDLIALARERITEIITIDDDDDINKYITTEDIEKEVTSISTHKNKSKDTPDTQDSKEPSILSFKPNFYKPLTDAHNEECSEPSSNECNKTIAVISDKSVLHPHIDNSVEEKGETSNVMTTESVRSREEKKEATKESEKQDDLVSKEKDDPVIPLIGDEPIKEAPPSKSAVSEIDILQALKNEILNESIPIPGAEQSTPLLHQPKLTKVACAQEIMNKKRISIEKYKEKTVASITSTSKPSLFVKPPNEDIMIDELSKKQSKIKLTEKECERFNLQSLNLDESSEEEDQNGPESPNVDLYENLAPKSPEKEENNFVQSNPIIIPAEPLKPTVSAKVDVDMRTMLLSPTSPQTLLSPNISAPVIGPDTRNEKKVEPYRPPLVDPRLRVESPNAINPERTPRPHVFPNMASSMHPNMTPSRNPNMTPSRNPKMTPSRNPNMTPSRNPNITSNTRGFEITPSHQQFDFEDSSSRKHVYAPFPTFDSRDRETSVSREIHQPNWEPSVDNDAGSPWANEESRDRNQRATSTHRDNANEYQRSRNYNERYKHREDYLNRQECPRTPVHPFGRLDCPSTLTPSLGRMDTPRTPVHSFGRSDCPSTPSHPFGRSDIPQVATQSFGRNECPRTPSHPFGRGDGPTTPSHPFGRGDQPTTPSHPFGRGEHHPTTPSHPFSRGDCPTTPSHPFGRGDCPTTPSHPFGRTEAQKSTNTFGRIEYGYSNPNINHKNIKDPRIHRNMEYNSRNNYNRYQKDNRFSDERPRDNNRSDTYRNNREQSISRNDKTYERGGPSFDRGPPHSAPREHFRQENDNKHQKEGSGYYKNEQMRDYQRASSVSRQSAHQDYNRSRAQSVGRNYRGELTEGNTLAVKPQTGHSFVIDTSVNRTFQEFLNKKGLQSLDNRPSFDARRQRAASVGRALLPDPPDVRRAPSVSRMPRESSVGRTLTQPRHDNSFEYNKRQNYMRARSVGRDVGDVRQERSFKDIKADFQSYSKSLNTEIRKRSLITLNKNEKYQPYRKESHDRSLSSRPVLKPTYTPKKFNYRDPRQRREQRDIEYMNSSDNRHGKIYGIVYSQDNIARGAIMGPGYGVRNYKIPKIKRPPEEQPPETKLEKETATKAKDTKETNKNVQEKKNEKVIKQDKNLKSEKPKKPSIEEKNLSKTKKESLSEKSNQIKKSSKLQTTEIEASDNEVLTKSKKAKKAVITSDSDTDTETKIKTRSSQKNKELVKDNKEINNKEMLGTKESKQKPEKNETTQVAKKLEKDENIQEPKKQIVIQDTEKQAEIKEVDQIQDDLLDSSFGIDDLAMFPDNLESDQVMDNINALIADLDNEIDDAKDRREAFDSELNIEKMIENIQTSVRDTSKGNLVEDTLKDIHELIGNLNKTVTSNVDTKPISQQIKLIENSKIPSINTQNIVPGERPAQNNICIGKLASDVESAKSIIGENSIQNLSQKEEYKLNDEIVSTSDNAKQISSPQKNTNQQSESLNLNLRSSTPDSTVTANDNVQEATGIESFPDSTNGGNSDISSTNLPVESSKSGPRTETAQPMDSIGNILSILKDKSKIKELLSMLGDKFSEKNEKIKKKLEKLSEIVSDDEDDSSEQKKDTLNESSKNESLKLTDNKTDDLTNKAMKDSIEIENQTLKQNNLKDKQADNVKTKTDEIAPIAQGDEKHDSNNDLLLEESSSVHVKTTIPHKGPKGKRGKKQKQVVQAGPKRVTRSVISNPQKQTRKKPSRELQQLQNDIKEMFISDDVLNATGIRMCRLAKLVDDKNSDESILKNDPVVVLEKFKDNEIVDSYNAEKIGKKKAVTKQKPKEVQVEKDNSENKSKVLPKHKPGPKSKTRLQSEAEDSDIDNEPRQEEFSSSESDKDSVASTKSFESSDALIEVKKKMKRKRGRGGWQSGIIKKKKKKIEKNQSKEVELSLDDSALTQNEIKIPDMNCFTDKSYCFLKNVTVYSCRLCEYSGTEIVHHFKSNHPHSEIPLSRMSQTVAKEAIEQCDMFNFQTISKLTTEKYVCRFCYKEFGLKRKENALEGFFWHVVSTHTGEYKQLCSECVNVTRCPFNLDIPPPPKDIKGQLIGYICGKCNFTQVSLENLKTHVIVRHNDEQTAVYTINLASMNKKTIQAALMKQNQTETRTLRSSRSNQSFASDDRSDITESTEQRSETDSVRDNPVKDLPDTSVKKPKGPSKSKISFDAEESDDNATDNVVIKIETEPQDVLPGTIPNDTVKTPKSSIPATTPNDVMDYSHFKICYSDSGSKEYVCCIHGKDNHYKTPLLISMKKHIQTKHPETWDGYCSICKVIVTELGRHSFKKCFQHLLDKHIDNFPVLEKEVVEKPTEEQEVPETNETITSAPEITEKPKPYINVRPLSQLLSKEAAPFVEEILPKINDVISFGAADIETASSNTISRVVPVLKVSQAQPLPPKQPQKYEEAQREIMSQKHQVVLDTMISQDKLVKIFKCAGKFCYFTSDSLDDSLLHANTHQRIGGENALLCSYCDFDSCGNAISLVTHVFKAHGCCPFVCSKCFYRAVSSQLVRAHVIKTHGEEFANQPVLKTETVTPGIDDSKDVLSRDVAVLQYVCVNVKDVCKFKTYTQGKFCEHLDRHQAPYICYICSDEFPAPLDLVTHMKSHGLKVLQCTWCIYGADNDEEFLAHAASTHPNRPPQGYFRVITSQEASKLRVLPLVQYNNAVPTEVVTPTAKENPVREAERALELESLINLVRDDSALVRNETVETPTETSATPIANLEPESQIAAPVVPETRPETPIASTTETMNLVNQLTPVLKSEALDILSKNNDSEVILLDSDEEDSRDSRLPTVDLANETPSATDTNTDRYLMKIPYENLYKCSLCPNNTYKTMNGFKRHINSHFIEKHKCAHCPLEFLHKPEMFKHYEEDHRSTEGSRDLPDRSSRPKSMNAGGPSSQKQIKCSLCNFSNRLNSVVKEHMKSLHGCKTNLMMLSRLDETGNIIYELHGDNPKPTHKRKLSMGSEQPAKKKRFGPENVNELPVKAILDELVYCALCEFSSKVRINIVRHLQGHADKQPVAQTVPVNPVPHLETNEKHFDKMVNLASSSIVTRAPDKPTRVETVPSVRLPLEETLRYPKYVSDRQRHTCGAKSCSYISVDEDMLKCHWETLHGGCYEFHCVHCPPYQQLDTSRPLTAARILVHLRMHDVNLYACSSCNYYHYKREILLKHLNETHNGSGQIMVVREEGTATSVSSPSSSASASAPTMDLKPWQCGLCKFKNMLRQEVVEHCSKVHNSKMQFKCPNCPFRTSTFENVTKHLSNSHPKSKEEVLYYYYREGSISDEPDGTPRWMKQRQKLGIEDAEVKTELDPPRINTPVLTPIPTSPAVDLDIVKKEVTDEDLDSEQLCKKFGLFCDPNGLKYKCPLCKVFNEDTKDAMQAHLFEELKYRKWGCSFCSYKAFHKAGLKDHIQAEHRTHPREMDQNKAFVELPVDTKVEKWVAELLAYQTSLIETTKRNFARLHQQLEKPCLYQELTSNSGKSHNPEPVINRKTTPAENTNTEELIEAFGELGASEDLNYCCPKCDFKIKEEGKMRDHLESELNKIRWRCSNCNIKFQDYHEAQLHCRTVHFGQSSRPVEAVRDPTKRNAWVTAVLDTQRSTMPEKVVEEKQETTTSLEDSLLVVRYEEHVPTPEELMRAARNKPDDAPSTAEAKRVNRKRPASTQVSKEADSDDERLIIDEEKADDKKKPDIKKCPHCEYTTKYLSGLHIHVLRHFNLKPNICAYCLRGFHNQYIVKHIEQYHPNQKIRYHKTQVPDGPPIVTDLQMQKKPTTQEPHNPLKEDTLKLKEPYSYVTCLVCEKSMPEFEKDDHVHPNQTVYFGKKGDYVVKCSNCFTLVPNMTDMKIHHKTSHCNAKMDYGFYKLNYDKREVHRCGFCEKTFKFLVDLKAHQNKVHNNAQLSFTMVPFVQCDVPNDSSDAMETINLDEDRTQIRQCEESAISSKRVAKKSTTKLPNRTVAKKSTTKLPYDTENLDDDSDEEYSYYGTKPTSLDELENVFTLMPFCNTTMPFSVRKLSEIIRINPRVLVKDMKK